MKTLKKIFRALIGALSLFYRIAVYTGKKTCDTVSLWYSRRSKKVKRCFIASVILLVALFAAERAYNYYDRNYGRYYWDRSLSENITLHSFADDKYRVYDEVNGDYKTDKIDWLVSSSYNDTLAIYAQDGKRGYINIHNGEIAVDAKKNNYTKGWVFSDSVAAVMQDNKIGFIDTKGNIVLPFEFDYSHLCKMWDFGYVFHNGLCAMTDKEGKLGLIDKSGNWIIEPEYDEIWKPHSNGYRVIIKDGMYGVIDSRGKTVHPTEYYYIEFTDNSFILTQNGRKWEVDFEGNTITPFLYNYTEYLYYPLPSDDECETTQVLSDYAKYYVIDRCGILNRMTGEIITNADYDEINMLSEHIFEVSSYNSNCSYLIDNKGKIIVKE
ncbi:MAG: WG repeat-containing protein [Bacteroidaceae bacterium]|nr:WG repeat-containing protein [Bacteroidaceae bacterium]